MDKNEWARGELSRVVGEVRSTSEGGRNTALNRAAFYLGAYAGSGHLVADEVAAQLHQAALEAGVPSREASKTIASGLEAGALEVPWFPDRNGVRQAEYTIETFIGRKSGERMKRYTALDLPCVPMPADARWRVVDYPGVRVPQGRGADLTWDELVARIASPIDYAADLPLWGFHTIEGDSRARVLEEGRDRPPVVASLSALALDYDDDPDWSLETAREHWGAVAYLAHTTRHHDTAKNGGKPGPRGRVIVPLSRPVTPDELAELRPWLTSGAVGKPAVPELKSVARAYFVPCGNPAGDYGATHGEASALLDVDALLTAQHEVEDEIREEVSAPVIELLKRTEKGTPVSSRLNVQTVLEHDPVYAGRIRRCDFRGRVFLGDKEITDEDETGIHIDLDARYQLRVPTSQIHEVAAYVARDHRWHPVREYLDGLTWDGTERLSGWLAEYMGAERTELHGEYGRKWLISAVARVMKPGCKVDTVLVLIGDQGAKKSTALAVLANQWFSDTAIDVRNKDAYQSIQGAWVVEWAELDSMRRSEATAVKAFLSSSVDRFRPAYGRNTIDVRRQCVFAGTTNEHTLLSDSTGSRRFWPVEVETIDLVALRRDRDQLWAEALDCYRRGVRWWLDEVHEAQRREASSKYEHVDPWLDAVGGYLIGKSTTTILEVLRDALEIAPGRQTRGDSMRLAGVLQAAGWQKSGQRLRVGGRRTAEWVAV